MPDLKRLNQATPAANSGFAVFGYAMSSSTARRWASVARTKSFAKRRRVSLSSHASPPRMPTRELSLVSFSASMKSTNSGALASVALPERSSFGMIMSASRRTVRHSCAVKNFGL
jgi:hypothetical protein